jgi:hypothetical protein
VNPLLTLASTLAPAQQEHLLEARQMQALSFAVHIPLVCFGIALPPLLLYVEWRYLRTATSSTARSPGAGRGSWWRCSPQAS